MKIEELEQEVTFVYESQRSHLLMLYNNVYINVNQHSRVIAWPHMVSKPQVPSLGLFSHSLSLCHFFAGSLTCLLFQCVLPMPRPIFLHVLPYHARRLSMLDVWSPFCSQLSWLLVTRPILQAFHSSAANSLDS